MTTMTVVQDGRSHVSNGGYLKKTNSGGVGADPMRVVMGMTVCHRGLVLSFSDRIRDATIIPFDSNGIISVNLHVSNPNT